jgi:gamma-glutamylcyclotransferase (GGCT)/AIG2-like uncharacterized protein YtfP
VRPHAPDAFDFTLPRNISLGEHWLYVVALDSRGVPHITSGRWVASRVIVE